MAAVQVLPILFRTAGQGVLFECAHTLGEARRILGCMPASPCLLDDVIATEALDQRAARVVSPSAEARAVGALRRAVAGSPRAVLQKLTDVALEICEAQSAGVSLLEEAQGRRILRWHAVSGAWAHLLWNTLPRDLSPCGTVLDRQAPLLMIDPERYFTPLGRLPPRVAEMLLVPFCVGGETVGTVWVVAHDPARRFHREDYRLLLDLTGFAALAYERLQSFQAEDIRALSRMHLTGERARKRRKPLR